jgi:hypothetical protein
MLAKPPRNAIRGTSWDAGFKSIVRARAKFPSFETLFVMNDVAKVPLYLPLLHVSDDASLAVTEIKRCVRQSGPNLTVELTEMFIQPDWRPHLVAAVALLADAATDEQINLLWDAISRPSWVSPQLAASASLIDPRFHERARLMIERRCLLIDERLIGIGALERHVALGPLPNELHSAKILSALMVLCSLKGEPAWLLTLNSASDIRTILASDEDGGGEIAVQWITAITPVIEQAQIGR